MLPVVALKRQEKGNVPGTLGVGALTFIGTLLFASYYDQIGLTLDEIWLLVLLVPVMVGAAIFGWSRFSRSRSAALAPFDPTSED